jgi:hypothetical protein
MLDMKMFVKLLFLPLLLAQPLIAEGDWSFAYEGDAAKRERLADLQDSVDLPALELSNWINADPMTRESLKGKVVVLDF